MAWWSAGREPTIGWGAIDALPDLVVEVLSPSTRANDLGPKRGLCMRGDVRELWLVDPAERAAVIVTTSAERRLAAGDELTSPLLPGLAIAVSDLLA